MSSELIAYTDESGNTGNNLFDSSQPWFWTGTLLAKVGFEQQARTVVDHWCSRSGVSELHGNELGLPRIEAIATGMSTFLRRRRVKFVFTKIEKEHVASTKFVDTFFDSGINKAVSGFHYGQRLFRLHAAHVAAEFLGQGGRKLFWQAYTEGDTKKFCQVLTLFLERVTKHVEDDRTKQVLADATRWAIENPSPLLEATATELDAPNVVALGLLMQTLHVSLQGSRQKVTRFVHDETNQFALSIKATYAFLRDFKGPSVEPISWISDWEKTDTFRSTLELRSSATEPGLQIIDVVLWLTKRYVDGQFDDAFPACRALAETVAKSALIDSFSRDSLRDEVARMVDEVMNLPLPESRLVQAHKLLERIEEKRQKRMMEPVRPEEQPPVIDSRKHAAGMRRVMREMARQGKPD